MITAWALAVAQGMNIRSMAGVVVPYPVRAEVGKRAAIGFFARTFDESGRAFHHRIAAALRMT